MKHLFTIALCCASLLLTTYTTAKATNDKPTLSIPQTKLSENSTKQEITHALSGLWEGCVSSIDSTTGKSTHPSFFIRQAIGIDATKNEQTTYNPTHTMYPISPDCTGAKGETQTKNGSIIDSFHMMHWKVGTQKFTDFPKGYLEILLKDDKKILLSVDGQTMAYVEETLDMSNMPIENVATRGVSTSSKPMPKNTVLFVFRKQ